ncbi:SpaA isopeptide-forming pilin-related protein [Kitasatospora sp. NPDC004799]|uniref:SpaA isopeptide-forming pilin-related protein n=1 Tax=Kitasatospora sp. NPDC004799 TaxID=3154460 RepID=UPI0033BCEB1D
MGSALALTLVPFGLSLVAPSAAHAAGLPGGLGPCLGADCPATFPPVNNGPFAGRDAGVNIFVGGDFNVRGSAAEAEGHVVTLGNFDMNKGVGVSSVYNVGIVGVGSRVPPPDGADFLTAGGNVTVAPGQSLLAEGGVVRYAGTASGTITGTTVQDPQAVAAYTPLRGQLQTASECYAGVGTPRPATGTAVNQGYQTLFTGDGTSALQVFNVDFDIAGVGGTTQGIAFAGIPANATVLVNLVGGARTINTYSGSLFDTDPWNQLRERLLWNFPTATTVTLTGSGQFQGSVLVGNPASTATMNLPGLNGRFFTTGSLLHNSGTGMTGTEFHAYPFNGDLPDCGTTPTPTGSTSVTKVDSVTSLPLAGATFQLWHETNGVAGLQTTGATPDTPVGAPCTTGADGVCSASSLPLGTYYWEETAAPPGYDLPQPAVTTVVLDTDGQNVPVTVRDTLTVLPTGSTSVTKVDSATSQPLAGATFQLWQETNGVPGLQTTGATPDTAVGSPCVTPASGVCSASGLLLGTYYWEETAAPPGYDLPQPAVTTVVLAMDGQNVPVTVRDTATVVPTGSTSVTKVDSVTSLPLAGATFQLWHETNGVPGLQTTGATPDTAVGAPCVTPATGVCSAADLPLGTYYWEETAAPPGYDLPQPAVTTVVLDTNGQSVPVTVRDTLTVLPTGSTSVTKVDSVTSQPLAGATFRLWRESNGVPGLQTTGATPDTAVGSPCVTPASGVCSASGLPLGTYYWEETAAPPGYDLPQPAVTTVVLDTNGQNVPVTVRDTATVVPTGSTSVTKVDSVTGQPLAGATFQLWHETNGVPGLQTTGATPDTAVGSPCVTPATGVCSAADLPLGTYYWQETAAPPGYDLPQPAVTTVVLDASRLNVQITVKDVKTPTQTGSTSVTKVDADTGQPLAGATFQLWRESNGVAGLQTTGATPDTAVGAPCVTPASGVCSADGLPLGTYYWQEVSAPEGYSLPQPAVTTVELTANCPCVAITVKDSKCPPPPCPPDPCEPGHEWRPYVRYTPVPGFLWGANA